jgi:hypothetical protein
MATTDIKPQGREALQEAAALLRGLTFSTARGALLEGEYVHLILDPLWSKETGDYRLVLTCNAVDQRRVDWAGLPIILEPTEDGAAPLFVARLNSRGQAIVSNLPAGTYRFTVSAQWFFSDKPIIESGFKAASRYRDEPERLTAADLEEEPLWPTLPPTFSSNDERVLVTPEQISPGEIALHFESPHKELESARVRFAITRPSGEIVVTGEVKLTKDADKPLWKARWQGTVPVPEPCHLMFEVFSEE